MLLASHGMTLRRDAGPPRWVAPTAIRPVQIRRGPDGVFGLGRFIKGVMLGKKAGICTDGNGESDPRLPVGRYLEVLVRT